MAIQVSPPRPTSVFPELAAMVPLEQLVDATATGQAAGTSRQLTRILAQRLV
jgi:hypothetical protein